MTQNGKFDLQVECYAGYRGEESPRCFLFGDRSIDIIEITDRWFDPSCRYFKVRANDGHTYILRHDHDTGDWQLTLFSAGKRSENRLSSS